MHKRIIVCCDGTWATPDQTNGGLPCPTNVTKIALGIDSKGTDDNGAEVEQRVYYHRGVGTGRRDHFGGGAFGTGLSRDVIAAYRFVIGNFQPGDELFLVGFSRGAYTARSTAGLIRNAGILRRRFRHRLNDAYNLYMDRGADTNPRAVEATLFRRSFSFETRIQCIAVWDTVGSLGIPNIGIPLVDRLNRRWQFHDTSLSTTVDNAFQALAIDERRKPFAPTLWKQQGDAENQRLEQVWFAGSHGDVGGGNGDTRLSGIALSWIADRLQDCGLAFRSDAFPKTDRGGDEFAAPIQEARTGFWRLLPAYARPIGTADPNHERVAEAALERHVMDTSYRPPNLIDFLDNHPDL
jgi:uncharacterized protein (DUF2235 family)